MDIEELRKLAEAATKGEREWDGDPSNEAEDYRDENAPWLVLKNDGHAIIHGDIVCGKEDAAFIAAANPETVLALIARIAELETGIKSTGPKPAPIRIDLNRMKEALASKSVAMPSGLSKEEKRRFIADQSGIKST